MRLFILTIILMLFCLYSFYNMATKLMFHKNPTNSNIYIKKSEKGGKLGRGVFASKDFTVGEIIELSPYIEDDIENFKGVMRDYVFKKDDKAIAVLGYVSLCNHMDEPNALWKIIDSNFVIIARYIIKKDEEIFISYGNGYWDSRNLEKL